MCGRTALTATPAELRELFGLTETPDVSPHYNVPPSQPVAAVRALRDRPGRRLEMLRWGLVPPWAQDPKIGHKLTLARVETIATTPAFRDAVRHRRCLVVVDGFYEWQRRGKQPSLPFFVRGADSRPFALGAVWDRWVSPDGEVIESCAIVTQPARPPVDAIHDRMPLVVERESWEAWLSGSLTEPDRVAELLRTREPALIAYLVGPRVNDPRHDDPSCILRAPTEQQSLF